MKDAHGFDVVVSASVQGKTLGVRAVLVKAGSRLRPEHEGEVFGVGAGQLGG